MFSKEEKKLREWKETIENTAVEQGELERAIMKGFQRAKNVKKAKKRPYMKRGIWSAVVVAILFITLVTSIRVSPVFASAVASIPGMERIVAFIQDDKGLVSAIQNEYYQPLNITSEKEGISFTLEGILADDQEMVIFYTVIGAGKNDVFQVGFPNIKDENGEEIAVVSASAYPFEIEGNNFEQMEKFNIRFNEVIQENDFIFEMTVKANAKAINFEIPFSVNKTKMPTISYPLNETVSIEGQKIMIRKIDISPLKVAIDVSVDQTNTKEILGFEDLRLVDGNGEVWSSINNGISASGDPDEEVNTYYLQSNYFEEAKELYLEFNKLMAIDKEDLFLTIDTEKELILKQPKDKRFSHLKVNGKFITIELRGGEAYHHHPFSTIIDANGKEIYEKSGQFSRTSDERMEIGSELPEDIFENPLKFRLSGYPNYIEGNAKIKIK